MDPLKSCSVMRSCDHVKERERYNEVLEAAPVLIYEISFTISVSICFTTLEYSLAEIIV